MKFEKLDSKQMPQVIVLGVLCVGVLAYAAFNFLGSTPRSNSPAQAAPAPAPAAETTAESLPGGALPALQGPGYNPDPFRPAIKDAGPVAPPSAPDPPRAAPGPRFTGRALPPADGGYLPEPPVVPPAPYVPPAPPEPQLPAVVVTGIIDVEGGPDMALVEIDSEQRIIQIGDMLNDYRVKRIGLDGILLAHGSRTHFVALGPQGRPGEPTRG